MENTYCSSELTPPLSTLHSKAGQQHTDQFQSSCFGCLKQWRHNVQAPALAYACRIPGRLVQPAPNPGKIKAGCYLIICTAITPPSSKVGAQLVTRGPLLSPFCTVRSTQCEKRRGWKDVPRVLPPCSLPALLQSSHSFVSSTYTLRCFSVPLSSPCSGRVDLEMG